MSAPAVDTDARERILQAADTLFGNVGFAATSTRQIAELSGANKALIHYYFGSKHALFNIVLDRHYARLETMLRDHLQTDADVRTRLLGLLDAYVDFLARNSNFSRMLQREVLGGQHVARITAIMLPLFQLGRTVVKSAFPVTADGPFEASQLLLSFYGMIVAPFAYGPVLEGLWGIDPNGEQAIARRKLHLEAMVELVLARLHA